MLTELNCGFLLFLSFIKKLFNLPRRSAEGLYVSVAGYEMLLMKEIKKKYYDKNKEILNEKARNSERKKMADKIYREKNIEKVRKYDKEYYQKNKERLKSGNQPLQAWHGEGLMQPKLIGLQNPRQEMVYLATEIKKLIDKKIDN